MRYALDVKQIDHYLNVIFALGLLLRIVASLFNFIVVAEPPRRRRYLNNEIDFNKFNQNHNKDLILNLSLLLTTRIWGLG